jgi:hypothetical protein
MHGLLSSFEAINLYPAFIHYCVSSHAVRVFIVVIFGYNG